MEENRIRILLVEPEKPPQELEIENTLEAKQKSVGGLIQAVYPWDDPVALVCNDEAKLIGLPLNRSIGYDIIVGTFLVCGLSEEDFASLSPELMQKYKQRFKNPELFINLNGRIMAIPIPTKDNRPPVHQKKEGPER